VRPHDLAAQRKQMVVVGFLGGQDIISGSQRHCDLGCDVLRTHADAQDSDLHRRDHLGDPSFVSSTAETQIQR
jgi:hypothetical protein